MIEKSQIQYWLRYIAAHVENMHEAYTPEKVARVVDKLLTAAPTKKDKNRAITDLAVLILYSEQLALALHEWAATVTLELLRRDGVKDALTKEEWQMFGNIMSHAFRNPGASPQDQTPQTAPEVEDQVVP